ncbi:MAG: hypothetical protein K2N71_05415 [Oscillospiraceae bacterium]|nr:hypothetical protein [Oscillospiraceae bacterium]
MSTREMVYDLIDNMSEEQLEGLMMLFGKSLPKDRKLKKHVEDSIDECERLLADPGTRLYSAEDALKELKS